MVGERSACARAPCRELAASHGRKSRWILSGLPAVAKIGHPLPSKKAADVVRSLKKNITGLALIQAANYLYPLMLLPYLARCLGPVAYGQVALAQIISSYLIVVADYGFVWSATRDIAAQRDDRDVLKDLFFSTWYAQWIVCAAAILIYLATVMLIYGDPGRVLFYSACILPIFGSIACPGWFSQAMERSADVGIIQIAFKAVAAISIFAFVRDDGDILNVLLINGISSILAGLLSFLILYRLYLNVWRWPKWHKVKLRLASGLSLFISRLVISLYTTLVPVVLAGVSDPRQVGLFGVADRLRQGLQSLITPIATAIYPRVSYLVSNDREKSRKFYKVSALFAIGLGVLSAAVMLFFGRQLVLIFGGSQYHDATPILYWFAPLPFIVGVSNFLGLQVLLAHGKNKQFFRIVASASAIAFLLVIPLTVAYGGEGAAMTILIAEAWVALVMLISTRKLLKSLLG